MVVEGKTQICFCDDFIINERPKSVQNVVEIKSLF